MNQHERPHGVGTASSDPNQFFQTAHLQKDLKGRSIRGGAVTLVSQGFKFLLQTGGTFFLARLLLPEDFGLIGMVTIVLNFVELFKDLGLSAATIQKPDINHAQVSTLFWINIGFSLLITVLVAVLAPVIAVFYGEARLTPIVLCLSVNFMIGGLAVQHLALLKRQMQFGSIARIEIVSMVTGVGTATVAAGMGMGYWSLIIWRLVQSLTTLVGAWLMCRWRPGLISRYGNVSSMLVFGSNMAGFHIVNYFSRNADNFLIGRFWGAQQLGLYAIAYKLLLLPIEQINLPLTNVALPTLSRLQEEPEKFQRYYYQAILIAASLGMPIAGFLFACADLIIPLALGQQWMPVIPIFRWLIPAAYVGTCGIAMGWAFTALGRVEQQFRWGLFASSLTVLIFVISVRWGALGVAVGYGCSRPLFLILGLSFCYRGTFLKLSDLVQILAKPFLASVGAIGLLLLINQWFPDSIHSALLLLLDCTLYSLFYLMLWIVQPDGLSSLREMLKMVHSLRAVGS
ncbi:MAG: lipopolysaccharide biosynthesis protein [Elainella sp. Prado103]|jgi:O-antigen/teichoic acid export membrane protein|nr:lipopolysaccharide biosynthesis protein [Elainella sp. Prado103]